MLEEILYCAYGCFSSVVAVLCIKRDVLLTEPGWMLLGSGFPFFASLGRQRGEEEGGCGLLSYLLSPLFSFHPPPPLLRHKGQDELRGCRSPLVRYFQHPCRRRKKNLVHPRLGLGVGGRRRGGKLKITPKAACPPLALCHGWLLPACLGGG